MLPTNKVTPNRLHYAYLFGILLIWSGVALTYFDYKSEEAYQEGVVAGVNLAKDTLKSDQVELALKWWVGSDEMETVRQRMCSNVHSNSFKPKPKKEGK